MRPMTGRTLASARQEVPAAVGLAQVGRASAGVRRPRVGDADAVPLDDRRDLRAGRRLSERGQGRDDRRTRDVVDAHRQQRRTRALVAEHEVHAAAAAV